MLTVSAEAPVLVKITACWGLVVLTGCPVKVRFEAERLTTGPAAPTPASATLWGVPTALSVKVRVPYRLPIDVGVKVTLMEQLMPTAKLAGQVLVSAKSPVVELLVMIRAAVPVLVRVTV